MVIFSITGAFQNTSYIDDRPTGLVPNVQKKFIPPTLFLFVSIFVSMLTYM